MASSLNYYHTHTMIGVQTSRTPGGSYWNDGATEVSADPEAQRCPRAHMPVVDTDPKPIKQVICPFIATYTDQKSSWCLYLLAHKLISVVSVTLSGDIVTLSQALLIVYQVSIGIFTWMESPYWLDFDEVPLHCLHGCLHSF